MFFIRHATLFHFITILFIAAILFGSKVTKNIKIISFYARRERISRSMLYHVRLADKIREKREYTSLENREANQFIRRQVLYIIASPIFIFPTSV